MNNKKRAIMVPVMTLAVCAIAMVGLGFALTTDVTSNDNAVTTFQIDIASTSDELKDNNGIDMGNDIDNILKTAITSHRNGNDNTYKTNGTAAYLRVYSNDITDYKNAKLSVSAEITGDSDSKIKTIKMEIYSYDSANSKYNTTSSGSATITVASSNTAVFSCNVMTSAAISATGTIVIEKETIYKVAITEITTNTGEVIETTDNITIDFTFTADKVAA